MFLAEIKKIDWLRFCFDCQNKKNVQKIIIDKDFNDTPTNFDRNIDWLRFYFIRRNYFYKTLKRQ